MKEGVGEDHANRERVAKLLRFASTNADTADEIVSLADYVARMKPGQDKIYYATAESFPAARSSPHLEVFRKKGIEVLLMHDRVDEWLVGNLPEFDGKPLASVAIWKSVCALRKLLPVEPVAGSTGVLMRVAARFSVTAPSALINSSCSLVSMPSTTTDIPRSAESRATPRSSDQMKRGAIVSRP